MTNVWLFGGDEGRVASKGGQRDVVVVSVAWRRTCAISSKSVTVQWIVFVDCGGDVLGKSAANR